MHCVILAGGLGTRLGELGRTRPKTLASVGGRPFADHQLGWLASQGVDDVVYCIGHLGDQIRAFVGDGSRWGGGVRYVGEGDRCLGTGGALRLAHDEGALADHFFVLYGDSWLSVDLALVEQRFGVIRAPAMMTVFRNDDRLDASNVWFAAGRIVAYDKAPAADIRSRMHHIDYGLSVLRRGVVALIPACRPADLAAVLSALATRGELAAYEAADRFFEIGTEASLAELDAVLSARDGARS